MKEEGEGYRKFNDLANIKSGDSTQFKIRYSLVCSPYSLSINLKPF